MKKVLVVVFVVVFSLCGCKLTDETPIKIDNTKFLCKIDFEDKNFQIDFLCDKQLKEIKAKFVYPNELKGLEYLYKDGCITTSFNGLKTACSIEKAEQNNIFVLLSKAMLDFNGKKAKTIDGNLSYKSQIKDKYYEVFVSPSGLPLSLSVNEGRFKAYFENLTLVK